MSSILFITNSSDIHANAVQNFLQKNEEDVIRLDTDLFSINKSRITFNINHGENYLSINNKKTKLSDFKSVWYRRPESLQTSVISTGQNEFAQRELKELLVQLYFCLKNSFWVSDYISLEKSKHKYTQLIIAQNCNFLIPKTCITNNPKDVVIFFNKCNKNMIYKTLHLPIIQPNKESEEILGVPTTIINEETIKHIELIKNSGGIFQEYIEKEYEIRVTIIGRKIFASKIDSQKDELSKIDWRDGVFYGRVNVYPYNLPKNVKQQCLNIVEKLGLKFGAIDLIKTPNNEYVFLEINPNGQWLWIEELTEQPLVEAMANLLSNPLI